MGSKEGLSGVWALFFPRGFSGRNLGTWVGALTPGFGGSFKGAGITLF